MPYDIRRNYGKCKGSKPFALVKRSDGSVVGCHTSRNRAASQRAALYASEENGMEDKTQTVVVETKEEKEGGIVQALKETPSYVPMGVTSFSGYTDYIDAEELRDSLRGDIVAFSMIADNIMWNPEIQDKSAAVAALAGELASRIRSDATSSTKSTVETFVEEAGVEKDVDGKERAFKTEGGVKFYASDYAYVPDASKPSTWKLRLAEDRPGNVTVAQLGRAAAAFSSGGFRGNRVQLPKGAVAAAKSKIRAAYRKLGVKEDDVPDSVKECAFMVWKSVTGDYRWVAVYTNNYRDSDQPAEILASEAHKEFVAAVDNKECPMPELWLWHVKGTAVGDTDWLCYTDEGFMIASGSIHKGKEHIAEQLAIFPGSLGVSHGMPHDTIVRSKEDPTVITRYRTIEISPLPLCVAANKLTGFNILKEGTMPIPQEKRQFLQDVGMKEEEIEEIEGGVKGLADTAKTTGVESKEKTTVAETVSTTQESVPVLSQQDIADAIVAAVSAAIAPVIQRMDAIETSQKQVSDAVAAAQKEAIIKETNAMSPAFSFADYVRARVVGADEAKVSDTDPLVSSKPKETEPDADVDTPFGFVPMISQLQKASRRPVRN